jgi:hypothetical protein
VGDHLGSLSNGCFLLFFLTIETFATDWSVVLRAARSQRGRGVFLILSFLAHSWSTKYSQQIDNNDL